MEIKNAMQQAPLPERLRTTDLVRRPDPRSGLISADAETMGGTPCFAGTRIPIKHWWDYLEGGGTIEEFMDDFEGVPREQCIQVLRMAREALLEGFPTALSLLPTIKAGQVYEVTGAGDEAPQDKLTPT